MNREELAAEPSDPGTLSEGWRDHSADAPDYQYSNISAAEFHPIVNLWPPMSEAELDELAKDIGFNDLHTPIWRYRDGRIIDGRNRWLTCQRAGVGCPSRTYKGRDGAELASFVFSLNEHRRHLTADQRAAIAADLASWTLGHNQHSKDGPPIGGPSPSVSVAEAAAIAGVSERSVERAKATKRARRREKQPNSSQRSKKIPRRMGRRGSSTPR